MKKLFYSILLLTTFSAFSNGEDKGYFDDHEQGWHWYKKMPEPKKTEPEKEDKQNISDKTKSLTPIEELKKYQKRLEEAKALAVMHPTRENIAQYQYLQYEAMERAQKFSTI